MKPVSQPLTREQAQVAFTHITHGKFALDDVSFWEATQRDFAGKCWHWELKSDSEKWGVITLDRTHFIHMAQYMEAGDRFAHRACGQRQQLEDLQPDQGSMSEMCPTGQ